MTLKLRRFAKKPEFKKQFRKQYKAVIALALIYLLPTNASTQGVRWTMDIQTGYQFVRSNYSEDRVTPLAALEELTQTLKNTDDLTQIHTVNEFFHTHLTYQTDQDVHGVEDYWTTPFETLAQGVGDCEDYAIGKYATLRILGVPADNLRLIYVRARIGGASSRISQAHMVLGYYPDENAEPLILDSLIRQILPASQRDDLTPVFSFNSEGLWAGHAGSQANSSPTSRLSRWRNVLERMQQQGINWENN